MHAEELCKIDAALRWQRKCCRHEYVCRNWLVAESRPYHATTLLDMLDQHHPTIIVADRIAG
jgi:hypothetical protein